MHRSWSNDNRQPSESLCGVASHTNRAILLRQNPSTRMVPCADVSACPMSSKACPESKNPCGLGFPRCGVWHLSVLESQGHRGLGGFCIRPQRLMHSIIHTSQRLSHCWCEFSVPPRNSASVPCALLCCQAVKHSVLSGMAMRTLLHHGCVGCSAHPTLSYRQKLAHLAFAPCLLVTRRST